MHRPRHDNSRGADAGRHHQCRPGHHRDTGDRRFASCARHHNNPAHNGTPASPQAIELGKQAGAVCPGKWESPECLSVISSSNLAMASNFGAALKDKGLEADAEQVKQHCAASTAAQKQAFPAYAMKSAFIECANLVADITQKTGVQPDLSQYQLMVGATMCLDMMCVAQASRNS